MLNVVIIFENIVNCDSAPVHGDTSLFLLVTFTIAFIDTFDRLSVVLLAVFDEFFRKNFEYRAT